jgi:dTDP-glucose pyrophosphorylase
MTIIIPMAGDGSRFCREGIKTPKPLINVEGKSLIEHSVESLGINGRYIFICREYDNPEYNEQLSSIFEKLNVEYREIRIKHLTSGPVETCLLAENILNDDEELLITNCDQLLFWNKNKFFDSIPEECDGAVVIYDSHDSKNSFAKIENNFITKIEEKKVISNNALVGIHYWKKSNLFIESGKKLLSDSSSKENYISETYNFLIEKNLKIYGHKINKNEYISLGTPSEIQNYINKSNEYYKNKSKTIFCDIDGTILKHFHSISDVLSNNAVILPGVKKKFDKWDSCGYKIILVSARKESTRDVTEKQLELLGIAYDILILGVATGRRYLINDVLHENDERATACNILTDKGFEYYNWDKVGL